MHADYRQWLPKRIGAGRNRSSSTTAIEPTTVVAEFTTVSTPESVEVESGVDELEVPPDIEFLSDLTEDTEKDTVGLSPLTRMTISSLTMSRIPARPM